MKIRVLLLIVVCATISFSQEPDVMRVVQGNTDFAIELYQKIRQESGNVFFSPYSISTALAMAFAGARGETERQMAQALHFSLSQEQLHPAFSSLLSKLLSLQKQYEFNLNIANALWIEKSYELLSDFLDINRRYYGANLFHLDFIMDPEGARFKINDWIATKTEGKIKDLLSEGVVKTLTRLVLTNTIYFKAEWDKQFSKQRTKPDDFWLAPGKKMMVLMMNQKARYGYKDHEIVQVLEMPYKGRALAMVIVLPKTVDGLSDVESQLSRENLEEWTSDLRGQEVEVFLPKFKTMESLNLKENLRSMGMVDAFNSEADLSGMESRKELFITDAVHKA